MYYNRTVFIDEKNEIEIGTTLFVEAQGDAFSEVSMFVGINRELNIVITPPTNFNTLNKTGAYTNFRIKYLFKEKVYDFQSALLKIHEDPVDLLELSPPINIQKHERRALARNKCFIPAKTDFFNVAKDGIIKDINRKGCRFNFFLTKNDTIPLNELKELKLACSFPGVGEEKMIIAKVANFQTCQQIVSVGLKFSELAEGLGEIIDRFTVWTDLA